MAANIVSPQCSFWRSRGEPKFALLELPDHILRNVFTYFSYTELCELRRTCKIFNNHCQHLLTQGFVRMEKFHGKIHKHVKSLLPRRESERRNHPLARHVDILSAIETRLSLLSMTYSKYMDLGLCCFIPGKVLDELWKILKALQNENVQPPRAHEFLQELRDISSMAMEHFEEFIVPTIKHLVPPGPLTYALSEGFPSVDGLGTPCLRRQEIHRMKQLARSPGADLQKDVNKLKSKVVEHQRTLGEQEKKVREKGKLLNELEKKILDKGKVIEEQERKMQEQGRLLTEQEKKILDQGKLIGEQRATSERQEVKINDLMTSLTSCQSHLSFLVGEVAVLKGVSAKELETSLQEQRAGTSLEMGQETLSAVSPREEELPPEKGGTLGGSGKSGSGGKSGSVAVKRGFAGTRTLPDAAVGKDRETKQMGVKRRREASASSESRLHKRRK